MECDGELTGKCGAIIDEMLTSSYELQPGALMSAHGIRFRRVQRSS
jgi:hypothetical protein